MAGRLNVALKPNADLPLHVVLPSIALRSRKDAVPDFPHQAGHHPRQLAVSLRSCGVSGGSRRPRNSEPPSALLSGAGLFAYLFRPKALVFFSLVHSVVTVSVDFLEFFPQTPDVGRDFGPVPLETGVMRSIGSLFEYEKIGVFSSGEAE